MLLGRQLLYFGLIFYDILNLTIFLNWSCCYQIFYNFSEFKTRSYFVTGVFHDHLKMSLNSCFEINVVAIDQLLPFPLDLGVSSFNAINSWYLSCINNNFSLPVTKKVLQKWRMYIIRRRWGFSSKAKTVSNETYETLQPS